MRDGQQAAKVCVAALIFRQQPQGGAIFKRDLGANHGVQLSGLRGLPEAHGTRQTGMIGERKAGEAQFFGARDECLGRRSTVEQGEVAVAVELGVFHLQS